MDAQLQVSCLLVESEGTQDLVGRVTKKEIKSSSNGYVEYNVTNIGDAAKIVVNKKKKKELLSKENVGAPTYELCITYKVQDENQENFNPPETSKEVDISSKEPKNPILKEMEELEDAAELLATMNQVAILVTKCSGD